MIRPVLLKLCKPCAGCATITRWNMAIFAWPLIPMKRLEKAHTTLMLKSLDANGPTLSMAETWENWNTKTLMQPRQKWISKALACTLAMLKGKWLTLVDLLASSVLCFPTTKRLKQQRDTRDFSTSLACKQAPKRLNWAILYATTTAISLKTVRRFSKNAHASWTKNTAKERLRCC